MARGPLRSRIVRGEKLEPTTRIIEEIFARGRAAWPGVEVSREELDSFLRAGSATDVPDVEPHADVYLACACTQRRPAAFEALERTILADVPKAIRRVDPSPDFVADVAGDLRVSLLDGGDDGSPLSRYRGRGPLRSFVMVLAMRRAIDRKRRQREVLTDPADLHEGGADHASFARVDAGDLRAAFAAALRQELEALSPRDRNILRLHVVEGVPVEVVARMYNVHRATVARWITQAKHAVFVETRASIERRFDVSPATFESFARGAALGFDEELSTFLRGEPGKDG